MMKKKELTARQKHVAYVAGLQEKQRVLAAELAEYAKEQRGKVITEGIAKGGLRLIETEPKAGPPRVLTTAADVKVPEGPGPTGRPTPGPMTDGLGGLMDSGIMGSKELVEKYGTAKEKKEYFKLMEAIEKRKKEDRRFTYWKCDNPRCAWRGKLGADAQGGNCFYCNWQNVPEGGQLRQMSPREIEEFEKDEAAQTQRQIARMKEDRKVAKEVFKHEVMTGRYK